MKKKILFIVLPLIAMLVLSCDVDEITSTNNPVIPEDAELRMDEIKTSKVFIGHTLTLSGTANNIGLVEVSYQKVGEENWMIIEEEYEPPSGDFELQISFKESSTQKVDSMPDTSTVDLITEGIEVEVQDSSSYHFKVHSLDYPSISYQTANPVEAIIPSFSWKETPEELTAGEEFEIGFETNIDTEDLSATMTYGETGETKTLNLEISNGSVVKGVSPLMAAQYKYDATITVKSETFPKAVLDPHKLTILNKQYAPNIEITLTDGAEVIVDREETVKLKIENDGAAAVTITDLQFTEAEKIKSIKVKLDDYQGKINAGDSKQIDVKIEASESGDIEFGVIAEYWIGDSNSNAETKLYKNTLKISAKENKPPQFADDGFTPANGATDVALPVTLSWEATDIEGDALTYDVAYGTFEDELESIEHNLDTTSYAPENLEGGTTYYWQVTVSDGETSVQSDVNSFTTLTSNKPPQFIAFNPLNEATGVALDATLSWTALDPEGNPLTYDVILGTSEDEMDLVAENLEAPSYAPENLEGSTTYYWQVTVSDGDSSVQSDVLSFTTLTPNTPPQFTADSFVPANGAADVALDVTLSWAATDEDGDPLTYDVAFGTSEDEMVLVAENLETPSYAPENLEGSTTYYWQVTVKDDKGASKSSGTSSFTTLTPNTPPQFTADSFVPANEATGAALDVTLSWAATDEDGDALTFDVTLGTSEDAMTMVAENLETASYAPENLEGSTTYYWQVTVSDGGSSVESDVLSFTTLTPNTPPQFTADSFVPANEATGVVLDVTLSWAATDADGDALTFDVALGTSEDAMTMVAENLETASYAPENLEGGTTYYWQVTVSDGGTSVESDVLSFTTLTPNTPPKFTADSFVPANDATGIALDVTLSWEATDDDGDALTYDVALGTSEDAMTMVAADLESPSYAPENLEGGTTYFWQVTVKDGKGGSESSGMLSFTTLIPNTLPEFLTELFVPENGVDGVNIPVELKWEAIDTDNDGLTFDVYIGGDSLSLEPLIKNHQPSNYTIPLEKVKNDTLIYWQVIAKDGKSQTESQVMYFQTRTLGLSLTSPENGKTNEDAKPFFVWKVSGDWDTIQYKLYYKWTKTSDASDAGTTHSDTLDAQREWIGFPKDVGTAEFEWNVSAYLGEVKLQTSPTWTFTTETTVGRVRNSMSGGR